MKGNTDASYLYFIVVFLSILGIFALILPPAIKIITGWDVSILIGEFFTVTAACTVITGIPCAAATLGSALLNVTNIVVSDDPYIKAVIFVPITFMLIYIAIKTGRGGG